MRLFYSFCALIVIARGLMIKYMPEGVRNALQEQQDSYLELDSNFNFRCNSNLKADFKLLCKVNQTSPSTAFKMYMDRCLRENRIL